MRVLLCSDIHGNAAALRAVLSEPANYVLCAGDLVHFGPEPTTCIEAIRRRAAVVVRGNHDHGAGFAEDCHAYGSWRPIDAASRSITDPLLSETVRRYLRALPLTRTWVLGGVHFTVVHAAPTDPLYRTCRLTPLRRYGEPNSPVATPTSWCLGIPISRCSARWSAR